MTLRPLAATLVLACLATAEATEYFVSTSGSDVNPGTLALPFASLNRAVEAATRSGDIVSIRAGTYTLAETANVTASGAEGSPITLRAFPSEAVVLRAADTATDVIQVQGSHVLISRLTARDGQVGIRIEVSIDDAGNVTAAPSDVTVEDCTITENHGWAGVQINVGGGDAHGVPNGSRITIRRCVITNNGETDHHHGIYIDGGDDVLIEDCTLSGNAGFGLHFYGDREGYPDLRVGGRRAVVRRNRCFGNGYRGHGGSGIVFAMGESPLLGIDMEWRDAVVEDNLCYDNLDYGIIVDYGRADGVFTTNAVLRNNTCFRNHMGQVSIGMSQGITLANNLLSRGGLDVDLIEVTSQAASFHADANFYDGPDGPAFVVPGGASVDFAGWRADGTRDARGAMGAAAFVSEAAPDLHLRAESQAIDRGVAEAGLFAGVDVDGQPRPQGGGLEMGADEVGGAAEPSVVLGLGRGGAGAIDVRSGALVHARWLAFPWSAYDAAQGEARVAAGDLDGDGRDELVLGIGRYPSSGGWAAVLDDASAGYALLRWVRIRDAAYDAANGEVNPACGDLDGDGRDEIVLGTGEAPGRAGFVELFDDARTGFAWLRRVRCGRDAYVAASGAVRPACGDVDRDGRDELVFGYGPFGSEGGVVDVREDALGGHALVRRLRVPWSAYDAANGETRPACGDTDGDGEAEVVVGLGRGGLGWMEVVRGSSRAFAHSRWVALGWGAYASANGETRPACADIDGDGRAETVVGLGAWPANGGWFAALDDSAGGFRALGWARVGLAAYDAANGETWPAIAR